MDPELEAQAKAIFDDVADGFVEGNTTSKDAVYELIVRCLLAGWDAGFAAGSY